MVSTPEPGDFVELRGRPWLVEALLGEPGDLQTVSLACISDDAQGERLEVLWDAETGAKILNEDGWTRIGEGLPDRPDALAAHLRTVRWRSATAADRDLLQAPFRAGIRLDAYQLLPLKKALRLPRVNLLIADDVGLGKTVEAGLVARERFKLGSQRVRLRPRVFEARGDVVTVRARIGEFGNVARRRRGEHGSRGVREPAFRGERQGRLFFLQRARKIEAEALVRIGHTRWRELAPTYWSVISG